MQQPILNGILESPLDLNGFGFVNIGGLLGTFQAHSAVLDTLAATSPSFAGIDILQIANPGVDSYLTVGSNGVPSYVATGNTVSSTESTTVDGQVVLFNGTTGKVIRKSTATGIAKLASGVLSVVTAPTGDLVGHEDAQILYNKTLSLGTLVSNLGLNFERPSGAGIISLLPQGGASSINVFLPSTSGTLITSAEVSDGYVPNTRTVNGHALSSNVTVTPTDLGLVIGTNVQAYSANLSHWAVVNASERVTDFLVDPTLANLKVAVTDETTVGWNLLSLANPDAITFLRLNANNSVSALDASTFRTAIGAGTSSTSGTVTSVSVTTANGISGSVANATTTPAITLSLGAITPESVTAPNDTPMIVSGGRHVAGPTFLGASITLDSADPSTHLANVTLTPVAGGSVIISSLTSDGLLKTSGGTGTVGVASMGAGVETALSIAIGSIGSFVTHNGVLGTPISGTLTNATGLPISGISGLASGIGTFLATPTLANLKSAVTDETTVGWNLLTLANPSATAFLRINSDNTVSAVDASEFRDELSLVIGTNVQAWDADLDTWATKTPYAGALTITTGKTFNVTGTLTLAGTDGSTLSIGTGGTLGTAAYTAASAYEPALGNPGTNGFVLSSTTAGVRSWIAPTTGTVTSVSVVTANGVSGTVATATTTPAITLVLGDITPSSVGGNTITSGLVQAPLVTDLTLKGGSRVSGPTYLGASITLGTPAAISHLADLTLSASGNVFIPSLSSDGFVKTSGGTGTLSVDTTSYVPLNGALGTPSSGTLTNCTFPTLNQNTTGSAATLTTPRSIYGNNFDGSAALGQVIASTYGGTGNGFTKFSGPTTSERTKILRDASDTILELGGSYMPTGTWTSLTLVTPALGTPASGVVTNLTGTASININGTVGATTPTTGVFTTLVAGSTTSLLVGTAGSAIGNIGFRNATSGTATLAPPTGALGTYSVTLPNAASTLPILGQQITFAGPTAARTVTLPDASFTVARTDAGNAFTGAQTISSNLTVGSVSNDSDTLITTDRSTLTSGISFRNAGVTKGYIGVDVTAGNIITGSATNDMVLRAATNMLFAAGATEKMRIDASRVTMSIPAKLKGYTVAALPAGSEGDMAYATDLLTPAFLTTAVGGGATKGPVFYNGTAWVAI